MNRIAYITRYLTLLFFVFGCSLAFGQFSYSIQYDEDDGLPS